MGEGVQGMVSHNSAVASERLLTACTPTHRLFPWLRWQVWGAEGPHGQGVCLSPGG